MKPLIAALVLVALSPVGAVGQAPAARGELLFSDDFERAELGAAWKVAIPAFTIEKGTLKSWQAREDHGAVGGFKTPEQDVVLAFRFRLEGSRGFNAVWDDKAFKGSHAGHICRVVVAPTQIRLGDDKEGVMRNDIFELRKDAGRKAEADKLLAGRGASFPARIEQDRWYQMRIEIVGDELSVALDGKAVGRLKSSGIGHPTKSDFHFTVTGKGALFDDVRLWAARRASGG
jgi:hypothetical protein